MIRKAEKRDIPEIAQAERENFSIPLSENDLAEFLKDGLFSVLVEERAGTVCGYIVFYTIEKETEILSLAVKKTFRGQGIAAALLETVAKSCPGVIRLEVRKSNTAAIRLYRKCGFVPVAVRKDFYEKPVENGITMIKEGSKCEFSE